MLGQWSGEQKMKVASRLLSNLMDSLKSIEDLEVGMRVYGHQFSVAAGDRSCDAISGSDRAAAAIGADAVTRMPLGRQP